MSESEKKGREFPGLPVGDWLLQMSKQTDDKVICEAAKAAQAIQNRLGQFQCYLLLMILQELRRGRA